MRLTPALATRAGLHTSLAYAALFAAVGAHLPYWPIWLADWGLASGEVGRLLGLALFVRLISATLLPVIADRLAIRRVLTAGLALAGAGLFLGHLAIQDRGLLVAATLVSTLALSPLIPMGEALGVRASVAHRFPYPHARAAGSLAFLVSVVLLGRAIEHTGPGAALWTVVIALVGLAVLSAQHPGGGAPPGGGLDQSRLAEAAGLLARPAFLLFAVAAAFGQASHAVYYVYGSLNWQAAGFSGGTIGLLWATGVVAEIGLMLGPGRRLTERIGAPAMLAVGAGAGVVRWGATALNPDLALLWPLQALHALTFGATHLGAMAFIAAALPPRLAASAQGMVAGGLGGAALALAAYLAAGVEESFGLGSGYWLAAGVSAIALAAALPLVRLWQGGRIID